MTAPRRRWFSFSLRMLFVLMTLFGVWLGWQVRIVQQRKAILRKANLWVTKETIPEGCASVRYQDEEHLPEFPPRPVRTKKPIPTWRLWLGDRPVEEITYFTDQPAYATTERLKRLFQEADVVKCYPTIDWATVLTSESGLRKGSEENGASDDSG